MDDSSEGVVSGLFRISSGLSFRLSQSIWYRKPQKQLQWTRQWAHWQLPLMIISLQVRTATKPWRELMLAPWAEFHALLWTFLFLLGTWRHLGFKYEQSVRNYCKPAWHLLVDAPVWCNLPLLGTSRQTAVLEWKPRLQAGLDCGLWI